MFLRIFVCVCVRVSVRVHKYVCVCNANVDDGVESTGPSPSFRKSDDLIGWERACQVIRFEDKNAPLNDKMSL